MDGSKRKKSKVPNQPASPEGVVAQTKKPPVLTGGFS